MTKLYTNCSEYTTRLGIKKSELPYIEKRIKEIIDDDKEQEDFLKEFTDWLEKEDETGMGSFISTGDLEPYNRIKEELLAKRGGICPFCKETKEELSAHIKEFHREEIKIALKEIDEDEFHKIKKEIVYDNL